MAHSGQQLTFLKRENEEESLKFLAIFSKHYPNIDKSYKLFWRTIFEECQKENIFPETNVIQLYSQIWPNFLQNARINFYGNGLTKVDQIVMAISKTRNPQWWGPPVASKNARARAIRNFNPPKVKIIEPHHASTTAGRRKRKDDSSATPAPVAKAPRTKKNQQMAIDSNTPLTSRPQETRGRKKKQPLPPIFQFPQNDAPGPSGFRVPELPSPTVFNPTTLATIASLIQSLSSAQSHAAASALAAAVAASNVTPSSYPGASKISASTPACPNPTPATPFTPASSSTAETIKPIFNFNFLPPPPEPPRIMEYNIEAHPTMNDITPPSLLLPHQTTNDIDPPPATELKENMNPLQDSSSFHLKLSSDDDEDAS
uniref:Uncharacterized protein n=1 Tax=Panagrolaimus davidi TaxID=227884 RepID=A0A914R682_9BILA